MKGILRSMALLACVLSPCGIISLTQSARGESLPPAVAGPLHGRTDHELSETYGSCVLADFRHHSWLTAKSWNCLEWQSIGSLSAANDSDYHHTFGPTYRAMLEILLDGKPVSVTPVRTAQAFDCRVVDGTADHLDFHRLDMMLASLQWASAWQCRNTSGRDIQLEYKLTLSDDRQLPKKLAEMTDRSFLMQDDFISYLVGFNRRPNIALQDGSIVLSWKKNVAPGGDFDVCLSFRSGWGEASVDKSRPGSMNFNTCAKLAPAAVAQASDQEFRACAELLGLSGARLDWDGLTKMAAAKQHRLDEAMPHLTGFPSSWQGLFDYTLDLLRVGTKMPQGQCHDIWMEADPMFYVWTFYWDTALTAHSYCNLDADAAARTLLTFLRGGIQDDGHAWIQFNPVAHYPNDRPQLMNIPMALWDCYQISRNKEIIAEAYPILARHQHWIDQVWNQRPHGPIADLDWNIDYGSALHKERHLWVDMTTFQVSQYEYLGKMAELLGVDAPAIALWREKAAQLKAAINQYMWNEQDGAYYCLRARDLTQAKVSCPIEFYTLTTGVASQTQAARLMNRLMDPAKYAPGGKGNYFCPSVSYDDPTFKIVPEGYGGWGGNLWLVEPYYTVRGLSRYGLQDEAFRVTTNLYQMAAAEYVRTGSIWEQYDPATGRGIHLKYFTSGITTSIIDMLLRGVFGFDRADDPNTFYLTPTPVTNDWHGIDNLALNGSWRLSLQMKRSGAGETSCKVRFSGREGLRAVEIFRVNPATGAEEPCAHADLDQRGEAEVTLPRAEGIRHLWKVR